MKHWMIKMFNHKYEVDKKEDIKMEQNKIIEKKYVTLADNVKKMYDTYGWEKFDNEMSLYTRCETKILDYYVKHNVDTRGLYHEIIPTKTMALYERYKRRYC